MTNRQLIILICSVTVLALGLAMIIERTQVRTFLTEFDEWWVSKSGGSREQPSTE